MTQANTEMIKTYQDRLRNAIDEGDNSAGIEMAKEALGANLSPEEIFQQVIQPVLEWYGDSFSKLEIFLPDLMRAGMVVKSIQTQVLDEEIRRIMSNQTTKGKVVIGTIQGDIHDIGKNMVALMLQVNGFSVVDLGVNVSAVAFIEAAQREKANIIAMSSLLTTSAPFIKDVIARLNAFNLRGNYKIIAGGAAINQQWTKDAGLDGYGKDAIAAVEICQSLVVA